jgi:hypothetical protein
MSEFQGKLLTTLVSSGLPKTDPEGPSRDFSAGFRFTFRLAGLLNASRVYRRQNGFATCASYFSRLWNNLCNNIFIKLSFGKFF